MRINKTFTLSFYSRFHRHTNEIALAANFYGPFSFSLTFGEWSWYFGIGAEPEGAWYGPFLSYVMIDGPNHESGYFTVGLSSNLYWESA